MELTWSKSESMVASSVGEYSSDERIAICKAATTNDGNLRTQPSNMQLLHVDALQVSNKKQSIYIIYYIYK